MKTIAAVIVALSLFSATTVQATTDLGQAPVATPAFPNVDEISDASRLLGDSSQIRQPEQTAFIWFIFWAIHCAEGAERDFDRWC